MGYIGVLFQAVKLLNYDVKLVPQVNVLVDTLDFTKERFFDIDKLMSIFDTIDSVSEMTFNNFDRVYEFIYLVGCKRKIKKR